MIRVFIADDHEVVKDGLGGVINLTPGMEVCSTASNGLALTSAVLASGCHVLILDINMPHFNGLDFVRTISAEPNAPAIILFTMHHVDSHALAYLRAGARSFINKRKPTKLLLEAISAVAEGRNYITDDVAEYLFQYNIDLAKTPHESLSPREDQVFKMLIAENSTAQISINLKITKSTINTLIQRIKHKLGVKTQAEILTYAKDHSLI